MSRDNPTTSTINKYPGTRIAFRSWKVVVVIDKDPKTELQVATTRLHGVTKSDYAWPPYESLDTECCKNTNAFFTCSCGAYGFKKIQDVPAYVHSFTRFGARPSQRFDPNNVMVVGEVEMWGRIRQYAQGYRAEHAYPKRLICPEEASLEYEGLVYRLAHSYGIEVLTLPLKKITELIFNVIPEPEEEVGDVENG